VITLCAEEVCPLFFGSAERLHWPLSDPAAAEGTEEERLASFKETRDELRRRIGALIAA
jgi:protein-tyrosine-phosphatase